MFLGPAASNGCLVHQPRTFKACMRMLLLLLQERYNLGEFKEELGAAMGVNDGEDETAAFLRRGYKVRAS